MCVNTTTIISRRKELEVWRISLEREKEIQRLKEEEVLIDNIVLHNHCSKFLQLFLSPKLFLSFKSFLSLKLSLS